MRIITLLALVLISLVGSGQAYVLPDSTFNGTGRNIFSAGGTLSYGDNIALQADGKMVMTGASMSLGGPVSLGVSRLNPDGSFDNSFGTSGISLIDVGGMTYQGGFEPEIVIQPDGKIVICGFGQGGAGGDDDMMVCRLLPNGSLDPAFGTGGMFYADFVGGGQPDVAYAITTDAAGNIYACGSTRTGSTPFTNDVAIIKLTPSGVLDPSFSGDGKQLLDISGSWDFGYGIALRSDGKIIVTGYSGLPADIFAIRLLPNGDYDLAFSGDGKATLDITGANVADDAWGMALAPDNKILIVGDAYEPASSTFVAAIVRFTADGLPDATFSGDGIATFSFSNGDAVMRNVIVQPNGKYLVSGNAVVNGSTDFAALMLNPDGTLDPSFNVTGKYTLDVSGQNKEDFGYGLALQQNGKILLSGNTQLSEFSNQKYTILRVSGKEVIAGFTSSTPLACTGQPVQFTNNSTGSNLTYQWTFEGGTPATSTLQNPSVTYNATGFFDVKLVATNGTVYDSLLVNNFVEVIATPVAPSTPSGTTAACWLQPYQYTTSAVQYANTYSWIVTPPAAGTITGNGTTATFSALAGYTGPYTIKVNAVGHCGSSVWSGELNCTLNKMPEAFMLQGNGSYCSGTSGASLTLTDSETGINYELYKDGSPSGNILPGTGSAITWNNIVAEGFYTAFASSSFCSQSMAGQIYVLMISVPVQPDIPTGILQVCNSGSNTYSTFNVPNATTYQWTLNPANAGTLTPNGIQVSVTWNASFSGPATLSVVASNDCGTGAVSPSITITVNDSPEPAISGLTTVCQNWSSDYHADAHAGSSYLWTVNGGTIVSGAGTASVTVNWTTAGTGSLVVAETSALNCAGTSVAYTVAVNPCVGMDELAENTLFSVYPNPVQNQFSVKLGQEAGNNSQLRLIDATGRLVATISLQANSTLVEGIDTGKLKSGFYTLLYVNDNRVVAQTKVVKY